MNSMVIFNSYISLPEGKQGERKPKMRWHNCLGGRWSSRMFLGCFRPGWWGIGHLLLTSMSQCWRETCVNSWRFYLGCLQKSTAQFYIMNHGSQRNQPWDRIDQMFSSANPVDGSLDIQYNNICFAKESPSSAGTKLCTITRSHGFNHYLCRHPGFSFGVLTGHNWVGTSLECSDSIRCDCKIKKWSTCMAKHYSIYGPVIKHG